MNAVAQSGSERRGVLSWLAAGAIALLLMAGIGHRLLLIEIERSMSDTLALRHPLETIPLELGEWKGASAAIDPQIREIGGFEPEFINRLYRDESGRVISVFVGYQGRPRTVFAHRADICYATHGWNETSRTPSSTTRRDGRQLPALLYEFSSPRFDGNRMLVLSAYIINGEFSNQSDALDQYNARDPGLIGKRKAYLARVQLALPAGGDRSEDIARLQDLLARLSEPLSAALPYVQ